MTPDLVAGASIIWMDVITTAHGELAVHRLAGPTDGDALMCLHGFTLSGRMFAAFAASSATRVIAPDLPGHGATTISPVTLDSCLDALAAARSDAGPGPVLGYSQGGRIAVHLAARRPDLVTRLVVVSAGPGLGEAERETRRVADEDQASRIESIGVAAFLDQWLGHPLTGTAALPQQTRIADRALRIENTAAGLAAALRGLGQGAVPAVDAADLTMPTLWISGGLDHGYTALMSTAAAAAGGTHIALDCGHNVVAALPGPLADHVAGFLGDGPPGPSPLTDGRP